MSGGIGRPKVRALVLVSLVIACSPKTQNVRALSAAVTDTTSNLEPVLALGYPSCIKAVEYHMLKMASDAGPDEQELLADDYERRLARCQKTKGVQADMLVAASTLSSLAAALTDLASDQNVQHVPKAPEGSEGGELGAATDQTVATIVAWAMAGYRKKQLGQAIAESAEPVREVLGALRLITTELYVEEHLEKEKANLTDLFQQYDRAGSGDVAAGGLRNLEYQRLLIDVEDRLARAKRLCARLEHLSVAHDELVQARGALNQEKLLAEVEVALADIHDVPPLPADAPPIAIPRPAPPPEQPPAAASNPSTNP